MSDRKHSHGGRGPDGTPPPHGHSTPEGSRQDPSVDDLQAVDPELVADLGAEFELRGDVVADELEAARAEAAEWRDKAARAQADFANTRKRLEASHSDALLRAGERIVTNLLPVLDDLDLAITHAADGGSDVAEGLEAVRRKLLDVIAREGCSAVDPFGAEFDPLKHSAVQMQEDPDLPDHTVCAVFQKGYEMHGRVLRPAMVVVSTGGPARE